MSHLNKILKLWLEKVGQICLALISLSCLAGLWFYRHEAILLFFYCMENITFLLFGGVVLSSYFPWCLILNWESESSRALWRDKVSSRGSAIFSEAVSFSLECICSFYSIFSMWLGCGLSSRLKRKFTIFKQILFFWTFYYSTKHEKMHHDFHKNIMLLIKNIKTLFSIKKINSEWHLWWNTGCQNFTIKYMVATF